MELQRFERAERGLLAEQLLERAHREVQLGDAGHDRRAREVTVEGGEVPGDPHALFECALGTRNREILGRFLLVAPPSPVVPDVNSTAHAPACAIASRPTANA